MLTLLFDCPSSLCSFALPAVNFHQGCGSSEVLLGLAAARRVLRSFLKSAGCSSALLSHTSHHGSLHTRISHCSWSSHTVTRFGAKTHHNALQTASESEQRHTRHQALFIACQRVTKHSSHTDFTVADLV